MIKPHPESDLRNNLLVLSADVISVLRGKESVRFFEDVMEEFSKKHPELNPEAFLDVLCLNYFFGFVALDGYRIKLLKTND